MKFPYVRFGIFYRPVIPVVFRKSGAEFPHHALLDTGADISLIHADIAKELGVDFKKGKHLELSGIGGKVVGYLHRIGIGIGSQIFDNVPVIFSESITPQAISIVGHEGLFDRMKITFDYKKKEVEITVIRR